MARMTRGLGRLVAALIGCLVALASLTTPLVHARTSSGGFYIVAFDGVITGRDADRLAASGAQIVGYEPDDSYIVWVTANHLAGVRGVGSVEKITSVPVSRKLGVDAVTSTIDVGVVVHRSRSTAVAGALAAMGNVLRSASLGTRSDLALITASLPSGLLSEIARRPDVLYIEPALTALATEDEKTTQLIAGNLGDDRYSVPGYLDWLGKHKLSGRGVTAAIVDTGINESHPDLAGRISKTVDYGNGPFPEPPYDSGGHGTHVAGIVAGSPAGEGPVYSDPDGFLYGMGVAPAVKLVNQNLLGLFSPSTGGDDNHERFKVVTKDAYEAGARMWNASWHTGQGSRAGYLASVRVFDELTRDALPKKPGSEEFLFVFSAGNGGGSGPTVPKEAKNIIAVGATNSGRGIHYPLSSDPEAMASFSSIGPTKDGRIFPTVSAPGANVISARAIEGSASLACGTPVDGFAFYCSISGTSMAAPHVTGASALIHEWWRKNEGGLPSPAMVKALLVNSAHDIGLPDIPNIFEGWGRIDLGELFAKGPGTYRDQEDVFRKRGTFSRTVTATGKDPLKVTVAWSDAPAAVGAEKTLVNDLDLIVERIVKGRVVAAYRGNAFGKGESVTGGKPDRLNNLENVFLMKPKRGSYRVRIIVRNLPGDGVPNNADNTDQDFALVIKGAR